MEKNYRYAIRKTTLGVGSVAIAAFLAGQGQEVQAAEQPAQPSSALAVDAVNPADQAGYYAAEGAQLTLTNPHPVTPLKRPAYLPTPSTCRLCQPMHPIRTIQIMRRISTIIDNQKWRIMGLAIQLVNKQGRQKG
ncbi:YSIRK-type signal peptide-containing protein [Aerococcus urinae]|uniref:YSIRK-type signal peptide-containing protein n=1 Tax=Aerococcus urinae TaxID=1376 RepID=UPI0018A7E1F3|nr:YSIRK-type signal peptide-containing protein [Aerococcus urinae]